jgi:hypothetical protein
VPGSPAKWRLSFIAGRQERVEPLDRADDLSSLSSEVEAVARGDGSTQECPPHRRAVAPRGRLPRPPSPRATLDDLWSRQAPAIQRTSATCQLLCLPAFVPDRQLAGRAAHAWAALTMPATITPTSWPRRPTSSTAGSTSSSASPVSCRNHRRHLAQAQRQLAGRMPKPGNLRRGYGSLKSFHTTMSNDIVWAETSIAAIRR